MEEKRKADWLWVKKPKGAWPLGRPRRRSVDTINTDLGDVRWGGADWTNLAQDQD
jgi:hypothetical protein